MTTPADIPGGDPFYTSGQYFAHGSGSKDARFKVQQLEAILARNDPDRALNIRRVADVGCGTGATTVLMRDMLLKHGYDAAVAGYDIHPHIDDLPDQEGVTFHRQDFVTLSGESLDLVVLFDVIEHVTDPIGWLREVAQRTRLVALHIPLDASLMLGLRNLWLSNLKRPGHLIVLDVPQALNLLAFAGLRTVDYAYSPGFRAPSGQASTQAKLMFPLRAVLWRLSPYVLQSTLGGVSLTVLAWARAGMSDAT